MNCFWELGFILEKIILSKIVDPLHATSLLQNYQNCDFPISNVSGMNM